MAVPKRKTAKSATRSRRATAMQISAKGLTKCPQCNEMKLSHRICPECGFYKGVEVIAK
ncbi:MAG: 50S ribosomal protein L32 [Proteocatella sp.]